MDNRELHIENIFNNFRMIEHLLMLESQKINCDANITFSQVPILFLLMKRDSITITEISNNFHITKRGYSAA